jgi:hypothetical protein
MRDKPAWQRLLARAADRFNAGFERMSEPMPI